MKVDKIKPHRVRRTALVILASCYYKSAVEILRMSEKDTENVAQALARFFHHKCSSKRDNIKKLSPFLGQSLYYRPSLHYQQTFKAQALISWIHQKMVNQAVRSLENMKKLKRRRRKRSPSHQVMSVTSKKNLAGTLRRSTWMIK